jgi:NADPH2:quinone reductase
MKFQVEMRAIVKFCRCVPTKGNYHLRKSPFIAGYEGAGVVVDSNNTEFNVGDRIAFADVPLPIQELVAVPVEHVIPLPLVSNHRHHSSSKINRSLSSD